MLTSHLKHVSVYKRLASRNEKLAPSNAASTSSGGVNSGNRSATAGLNSAESRTGVVTSAANAGADASAALNRGAALAGRFASAHIALSDATGSAAAAGR